MSDRRVMGILLHGRENRRMGVLMDNRTIGSIPFGGRYRLIDFMLSSMVNANISDIGVITRDKYASLTDHLGSGRDWDLARKTGGLLLLPPAVGESGLGAYRGELESLFGHRRFLESTSAQYVFLSTTDLVCNIDLSAVVASHISSGAEITVLVQKVECADEWQDDFVSVSAGDAGRIVDITVGAAFTRPCLRYLGAFIISKALLIETMDMLISKSRYTIVRDLLQGCRSLLDMRTYNVEDFCVKITGLKDYFETSMSLLDERVRARLFWPGRPVLTRVRDEAPAFYGLGASVGNSLVADGCQIEGRVENSVLFRNVRVGPNTVIKNCVLMQDTVISAGAELNYVIADRRCFINEGRVMAGFSGYPVAIEKFSVI